MSDESTSDGLLVIRASRGENGEIHARITHGTAGQEPSLEIANVTSEDEVISLVREWLNRIHR